MFRRGEDGLSQPHSWIACAQWPREVLAVRIHLAIEVALDDRVRVAHGAYPHGAVRHGDLQVLHPSKLWQEDLWESGNARAIGLEA